MRPGESAVGVGESECGDFAVCFLAEDGRSKRLKEKERYQSDGLDGLNYKNELKVPTSDTITIFAQFTYQAGSRGHWV